MLRDNSIKTKVLKNIEDVIEDKKLIKPGDKILVAVSGGSDSMCLLYALILLKDKLKIDLEVAHVNHMLREESDAEEMELRKFCNDHNIIIHVGKFDIKEISKQHRQSTETAARNIRYIYFRKVAKNINANKIAVAHNTNDNAETVLMHFIRGSSLNGLTGIQYKNNDIIRPLLNLEKKDINAFCIENNISYAIDKTNSELIYTRNKVRLDLIKRIEEYNPNFINSVSRMTEILTEEEEYINQTSYKELKKVIISETSDDIIFDIKVLNNYDKCIRRRIIILLIQKITNRVDNIEYSHVKDINNLIEKKIKGKKFIVAKKYIVEIVDKQVAKIKKDNL